MIGLVFLVLSMTTAGVLSFEPVAQAKGKLGAIYVHSHYNANDFKALGSAKGVEIYIYDMEGALISSGLGNGAFKPGKKIDLEAGEYLVEVGNVRSINNLRKIKVVGGQTTEIKTGWVAVTTWPLIDQPIEDCAEWSARLKASIMVDGRRVVIMSNRTARRSNKGRIQLPVGTYELHFNGLTVPVQVEANKILHLSTGGLGPFLGTDVRISKAKSDDSNVPSVAACSDGPIHLLAGKWWLSKTEKTEDYPYEKRVWEEVEVPVIDEGEVRSLKPDRLTGRVYRGAGSELKNLDAQTLAGLSAYKKGVLKKGDNAGSKFQLDDNPF
jgi:hypothetical protein